jgi:hypothetical protein
MHYQKLLHPFSNLLKELPVADGSDVNLMCNFLLKVLRMNQVGHMVALMIYEILYLHCRSEVLGLLTQALTASESFDFFHERLLRQFIPVRQLSQLCIERYERV